MKINFCLILFHLVFFMSLTSMDYVTSHEKANSQRRVPNQTVLMNLCSQGTAEEVELILYKGAKIHDVDGDLYGRTPLMRAAKQAIYL